MHSFLLGNVHSGRELQLSTIKFRSMFKENRSCPKATVQRAEDRAKATPTGGVGLTSVMLILDNDEEASVVTCSSIQVSVECYAMVGSQVPMQ